jgi:hypothetical protein
VKTSVKTVLPQISLPQIQFKRPPNSSDTVYSVHCLCIYTGHTVHRVFCPVHRGQRIVCTGYIWQCKAAVQCGAELHRAISQITGPSTAVNIFSISVISGAVQCSVELCGAVLCVSCGCILHIQCMAIWPRRLVYSLCTLRNALCAVWTDSVHLCAQCTVCDVCTLCTVHRVIPRARPPGYFLSGLRYLYPKAVQCSVPPSGLISQTPVSGLAEII